MCILLLCGRLLANVYTYHNWSHLYDFFFALYLFSFTIITIISCGMFLLLFWPFSLLVAYFVSIIARTHLNTIVRRTRMNISFVLFVFLFRSISSISFSLIYVQLLLIVCFCLFSLRWTAININQITVFMRYFSFSLVSSVQLWNCS